MSPDPRWKWFRQLGIAATILLGSGTPALADDPAFDRPGIAFSPSTLAARAWAWEQGLPDFQQDRVDGVTEDAYLRTPGFVLASPTGSRCRWPHPC